MISIPNKTITVSRYIQLMHVSSGPTLEKVCGLVVGPGEGRVDVVGQAGPAAADGLGVAGLYPFLYQGHL
jgi:hypothetical protein